MNTLVDLKRGESTLIRTIDAASQAIDGVGTSALEEALERLEHAAVEARVRLDAAMSRMRDIVGTLTKAVSGQGTAILNDLIDSAESKPSHTWRVEIAVSQPAEQPPLGDLPAEYDAGDPEPTVTPRDIHDDNEVIDLGKLPPHAEAPAETHAEPTPEQPAEATVEQPAIRANATGETPDVGKNSASESAKVPKEEKATRSKQNTAKHKRKKR